MPLALRVATLRDAPAFAAIYAPYVRTTTASFETLPPTKKEMAERIDTLLGTFPWLVCQNGDEVLGYAYASRLGQRAGYDWAAVASVYIKEGARRTGAGAALYTALIALLRAQGYRTLTALVACPNPESERFHAAMGFARQGMLENVGYKFGRPLGVAYYGLQLLPPVENPPPPRPFYKLDAELVAGVLGG